MDKKEFGELMDTCFPKDPEKETVREEDHPEKEWFKEAGHMKLDKLPEFIDRMLNHYNHDYGTICHAVSACAIGAAWAACDVAGLTVFQAGFVMWDFIRGWHYMTNKCGLKIFDYDKMLFPQYAKNFEKVITKDVWEKLQEEAKERMAQDDDLISQNVRKHWKSIIDGQVPFGYRVIDE